MIQKNTLRDSKIKKIFFRLPSIVWVILLPLGLLLFIGLIILLFYCLANIEGFDSIVMIISFFLVLRYIKWFKVNRGYDYITLHIMGF